MSIVPPQPPEPFVEQPPGLPVEQSAEPAADQGVGQAYLLLAISFCLAMTVGSALQHFGSPYAGLAAIEATLFVVAVVYVHSKAVPIAAALRWRPIRPAQALLSVGLGASAFSVGTGIILLTIPILGPVPQIEILKSSTPQQLGTLLFCGAILPGICEETLFRGVIQSVLGRRGAFKSVLITSLLFGLFHINPWNFLPPLFYGVVFGIVTLRTRSTIPAMIAHTTTNVIALTFGYWSPRQVDLWVLTVFAALVVMFAIGFTIYLVRTRHRAYRPGLLARVPAALSKRQRAAMTVLTLICACLILLVAFSWWAKRQPSSEHRFGGFHRGDCLRCCSERSKYRTDPVAAVQRPQQVAR